MAAAPDVLRKDRGVQYNQVRSLPGAMLQKLLQSAQKDLAWLNMKSFVCRTHMKGRTAEFTFNEVRLFPGTALQICT